MKRRVAARLLLASCTLALALGLGTAIAVTDVVAALRHPDITVSAPGQAQGRLDRGRHELFVRRDLPGGGPPLSVSRPDCTVTDAGTGQAAPAAPSGGGFAAFQVRRGGAFRLDCRSAAPVHVTASHVDDELGGYLTAIGRGLLVAVVLTVLAAVLAARALLAARRLRSDPPGPASGAS